MYCLLNRSGKINMVFISIIFLRISSWLKVGASGMTVQEIGVPTGFEADLESITQLPTLKKIETENRKIVIYLDEVGLQLQCILSNKVKDLYVKEL